MAAEIARLARLEDRIDATGADKDPRTPPGWEEMGPDEMAALPKAEMLPDGRHRPTFFERVREEIVDRIDSLSAGIALEECRSMDDVAVVAVLFREAATVYVERRLDGTKAEQERAWRTMRRIGDVLARGVQPFVPSEMLERFVSPGWSLHTWAEELALAEAELAKLEGGRHV
jgi:hypothetical protein